ncbi:MAG: type II toxin-antitoxin system Phd/YefM family antitoxin [Acidimicrobiia bacterium]|nr:type II toxin-antitoxin system Phd/YefM family antitoxin [Acidimicrobiia bacterium]
MERPVNIHEAKTHLSRLVGASRRGGDHPRALAGRPVARLIPYRPRREPRKLGMWKGKVWLADDWDSAATNAEIGRLFDS